MHVDVRNDIADSWMTFSRFEKAYQAATQSIYLLSRVIQDLANYSFSYMRKRRYTCYIENLDSRTLKDIGIARSEVSRLLYGPRDHSGCKIPDRSWDV